MDKDAFDQWWEWAEKPVDSPRQSHNRIVNFGRDGKRPVERAQVRVKGRCS
ncbi:MAG: hypothetical protein QOJ15_670 [Bradyrhizobium sp.]|jgi:hypothetical protein|nr:hypothetical protein [Bradyrhizobium sp.]